MERNVTYQNKPAVLIQIDNFPLPKPGISGVDLNIISIATLIQDGLYKVCMANDLSDGQISVQTSDNNPAPVLQPPIQPVINEVTNNI